MVVRAGVGVVMLNMSHFGNILRVCSMRMPASLCACHILASSQMLITRP